MIEKVKQLLNRQDGNIVFFFDDEASYQEELREIEAGGIEVIHVAHNFFDLKIRIEMEKIEKPLFLYHNYPKPEGEAWKKYPLLDLYTANSELRLDEISEFIAKYDLLDSPKDKALLKKYWELLKDKNTQKKIASVLSQSAFKESNIERALISLALGFKKPESTNKCIGKWLHTTENADAFEQLNANLKQQHLESPFLQWIKVFAPKDVYLLDFDTAKTLASRLKYNVLMQNTAKPVKEDTYVKLKAKHLAEAQLLVHLHSELNSDKKGVEKLKYIFDELASEVRENKLMEWYGINDVFGFYSEEMEQQLLASLYAEVLTFPDKVKTACSSYSSVENVTDSFTKQVEMLNHLANVLIQLKAIKSYTLNTIDSYVVQYTTKYAAIDKDYRHAILAYEEVDDKLFALEDTAKNVVSEVSKKYDRFINLLNVEWMKMLEEKEFDLHQVTTDKQYEFFAKHIAPMEFKTAVIISDAFRYELATELSDSLLENVKNNIELTPALASIPSYTNLGMSNLLPHTNMAVEEGPNDLIFSIDGIKTVSNQRETILRKTVPESGVVAYTDLRKMNKTDKRELFKANKLVYIYHDWIDAIGDKKGTEHQTFAATSKAIDEIAWTINNLTGELGISYVVVTSDHGFLYNRTEIEDTSREDMPQNAKVIKDNSRFLIAEGIKEPTDGYVLKLANTTELETNLKVALPRATNRFRKKGNIGLQFVHGGGSLQEIVIPILKIHRKANNPVQKVDFSRLDRADKITTSSIKIQLMQIEGVTNQKRANTIVIGLYTDQGVLISDEQKVILNATSEDPRERIFDVTLNMVKHYEDFTFCFLRAYSEEDTERLNPKLNDNLKIISLMGSDF